VTYVEVGTEGLDGGRTQLLGDQHDGAGACGGYRGHDSPDWRASGGPARLCASASVTDTTPAALCPVIPVGMRALRPVLAAGVRWKDRAQAGEGKAKGPASMSCWALLVDRSR